MVWKYKIELSNSCVFNKIEKERGVVLPEELKEFITETNAGTPDQYRVMVGKDERVFGAVLCFNENEQDVDTVFLALEVIKDKNYMPFAIDPFGNYFCYSFISSTIAFWNHEEDSMLDSKMHLSEFLESMY